MWERIRSVAMAKQRFVNDTMAPRRAYARFAIEVPA
jgi:hypothetical protein